MDQATRALVAHGAAVGALIQMQDVADPVSAVRWMLDGMTRAPDAGPQVAAQVLLTAVDMDPGVSDEALYLTAALAWGGDASTAAFEALPAPRRMAFRVFGSVAACLPRMAAELPAMADLTFRPTKGLEPGGGLLRARRGLDFGDMNDSVPEALRDTDATSAKAKTADRVPSAGAGAGRSATKSVARSAK